MPVSSLGTFLRGRRERISPTEVGLPAGGRRRTPGLRREELAMMSGISVDYLVRLEQGRDQSPSAAVLAALSDVLRLDEDERRYLTSLAAATTQTEMCPRSPSSSPLSYTTFALLERLHPTPAFVLERWAEVLAWNPAYDRLMRPSGLLDLEPPNLARYTFLEPAARSLHRDWSTVAREQVASLRAATADCHDDGGALEALVGELSVTSADFARLWANHEVGENRRGIHRMVHPVAGRIEVEFESLILAEPAGRRLVAYLPANESSATAIERLTGEEVPHGASAGRLRVV